MKRAAMITAALLLGVNSARAADHIGTARVDAPGVQPSTRSANEPLADYDPDSRAWNGLATFVSVAEGLGFEVKAVATLEWGDLSADDVLVMLYPLRRVDPARIEAFISAGGNAVIADDFGDAGDAIAGLQLIRGETATPKAARFADGKLFAPIATVRGKHPIGVDVGDVVTNHPAVLTHVEGATQVVGFDDGSAVVVAGQRGTGKFVVVSDPSIFINRMLQFPGDMQLSVNILRWLNRDGRAKRVVLLRGDVPMYGDPAPFIDDANADALGRGVADVNRWLGERNDWLLTPDALKVIATVLALLMVGLVGAAMPRRRGSAENDGSWLTFLRPARRDDPARLLRAADSGETNFLSAACVLRDLAGHRLRTALSTEDPLVMTDSEFARAAAIASKSKNVDVDALAMRVHRRLRALPQRAQAAAPWAVGTLNRRDFDQLYGDLEELCRTLGTPL